MDQRERMGAGMWYDANFDESLLQTRVSAMDLADRINRTPYANAAERQMLLEMLIGHLGKEVEILSPIMVDYGSNVTIGDHSFINHSSYLMDGAPITIGSYCFIGPYFGAYTAQHPLVAEQRNRGFERAKPITIGDNCWIGANVSIMPGVTIGEGCVIGGKSLVSKDIPAGYIAVGDPCRPMRPITAADRISPQDLGM